jgi:hypothetical protein
MPSRRPWFHGLALVAGALLVGVAGIFHPMLAGDGAGQLAAIDAMPGWRTVHWAIVFGYVLVVAGLTGLVTEHATTPGASGVRTGVFLSTFGYLVSMVGVLFMLGAASTLAATYRAAEPGLAGTHAVFVYDMLHPAARAALRVGAFAVALALYALGWGLIGGDAYPRWLGWLAVGAGAAGAAVAVLLAETSPYVVAGVGLATLWQLAAGVTMLVQHGETRNPERGTRDRPANSDTA